MDNPNVFKEIKEYLKPQQVAQYYLSEKAKKSGNNLFYKSPFRNEKTASFCVNNEKGFHDYGSGWHGDIINFVQEMYHISPIDAAKLLIKDFALPIEIKKKNDYKKVRNQKRDILLNSKVKAGLQDWFKSTFIKLCDANKINKKCILNVRKSIQSNQDFENNNIVSALQYLHCREIEINLWIEEFINVTTDDEKLELFRHRKEIEKICY